MISKTYPRQPHRIRIRDMLKQCVHRSCTARDTGLVTLFSFLIGLSCHLVRNAALSSVDLLVTMMKFLRPEQCAVWDGKPCAACDEDIELEKEKKELEIRIEKIDLRRRALRTVMNENHDCLIPRFPLEIASDIFIRYAPPSALFDKDDRSTPLYLGAVCQKWRELAWATPQLWSSLLVGFIESGQYDSSDLSQLIVGTLC
jgi:hypothetical protein